MSQLLSKATKWEEKAVLAHGPTTPQTAGGGTWSERVGRSPPAGPSRRPLPDMGSLCQGLDGLL